MKIQADGLVVRDKEKMATFTGNVHVTQGDTEMCSKALVVYYVDGNTGTATATGPKAAQPGARAGPVDPQQIRRIEATGGVTVTQKDQNAAGDTGIFDMPANTVTLTGNVVVTRGRNVMRGQRLVVDLNTGVSHVERGNGAQVESLIQPAPQSDFNSPARPAVLTTARSKC